MKIDYQPLTSLVTKADIKHYKKINSSKFASTVIKNTASIYAVFILLVVLFVLISYLDIIGSTNIFSNNYFILLVPLFFIIILVLAYIYNNKKWKKYVRLFRFAEKNGMRFVPQNYGHLHEGMVFNIGTNRREYDLLCGTYNNKPFEISNFKYEVGSGKNRQIVDYGYIMLILNRNLPHMVLDSQINNVKLFGMTLSGLPVSFNKDQVLSLEGDFDKSFTLYAPKEYERDALYIFTPDLMALFIDESGSYDAEIVDNKLFIYSLKPFNLFDNTLMDRIFDIIDTVGKKTILKSDHYADERVGKENIGAIDVSGQRLKKSIPWALVIIFGLYILFRFLPDIISLLLKISQ